MNGAAAAASRSYWSNLAAAYRALGPPLCPSPSDLQFFEAAARQWQQLNSRPMRGLLLGATATLAEIALPDEARLFGIDHSMPMAKNVWPGDVPGVRAITCADWRRLPLSDNSIDVVFADGSLNCVRYPDDLRAVAKSLSRVIAPDGVILARCYLQAETPESLNDVFHQAFTNPFPTFHYFKLQFLMAMQKDPSLGTRVGDAYKEWASRNIDIGKLVEVTGWNRTSVEMIELYKNSDTVHAFPTQKELLDAMSPYFTQADIFVPGEPLGDRTPTLVLRPTSS